MIEHFDFLLGNSNPEAEGSAAWKKKFYVFSVPCSPGNEYQTWVMFSFTCFFIMSWRSDGPPWQFISIGTLLSCLLNGVRGVSFKSWRTWYRLRNTWIRVGITPSNSFSPFFNFIATFSINPRSPRQYPTFSARKGNFAGICYANMTAAGKEFRYLEDGKPLDACVALSNQAVLFCGSTRRIILRGKNLARANHIWVPL